MSFPKIKFNVSKTGLELNVAQVQKIPGIIITGSTVVGANNVTIGNSYQIFSLDEAINMGITETGTNSFAYNQISNFYKAAGKGSELWFMLVSQATSMEDALNLENDFAKKLLSDAKGKIRILGVVKKSAAGDVIVDGLDEDVKLAVIKAQALCEDFAARYFPVRTIISGNKFTGVLADLKDYSETSFNRVSILLGNNDASAEGSVGLYLGRSAIIPTQRKVSRVKDGAVEELQAFFTNGASSESLDTSWEAISGKNYIFFRSFANKSGYYFSGDQTLTTSTDDFKVMARGLVMDEAVLIAYDVMTEELSDEIPVTESGTIQTSILKGWQNAIERNIKRNMIDQGKLSAVKAFISENQNILTSDEMKIDLQLLPVGYSDFITVNIGFTTNLE